MRKTSILLMKMALLLAAVLMSGTLTAQTELHWKGSVDSDGTNAANWEPQQAITDNILVIDTADQYSVPPVFGGSDSIFINNLTIAAGAGVYFMTYVMGMTEAQISMAIFVAVGVAMLWIPVINFVSTRLGKRWAWSIFVGIGVVNSGILIQFVIQPGQVVFYYFLAFLIGSYLIVCVGRRILDRKTERVRTEYVDAWGDYRLTQDEIDTASAQLHDGVQSRCAAADHERVNPSYGVL